MVTRIGSRLLQRTRTYGHRFFHRFGIHCAKHQIRVILISGFVITSLFYPALAIYASSQPRFLAHFSSQILDPFLATDATSSYYDQHDLIDIWAGHENLRVREDSVARARCGVEQTLRLERLLIHSSGADDAGVLNRQILLSALKLEREISTALAAHNIPCLRKPDGQCLAITPLEFWHHDQGMLLADTNILDTLSDANNVSVASVSITPRMVLAGRERADFAEFLVFTYFFPDTDCLQSSGHQAWDQLLKDSAKPYSSYVLTGREEPRLIELSYATAGWSVGNISVVTIFLVMAYLTFAIVALAQSRKFPPVHSGLGLIFTGAVEIVASTITSLSVCALVGFKMTMIPWGIFPLVILFIGAETMANLVTAVVKTSIALPVKERIAEGLSRAGTSNTLKVLTYNVILGVIAFFAKGAIRQFCAFAVVVLVAHWFLVHTFFVAVLSIDFQRLELEELLQQNASLAPAMNVPKAPAKKPAPNSSSFFTTLQNMLRGRATKNVSLLLLLACMATLYYATSPSFRTKDETQLSLDSALLRSKLDTRHSPAWRMLNPDDESLIHIRIEAPTVLVLRSADDAQYGSLDSLRPPETRHAWAVRSMTWLFRIVCIPLAVTLTALYGLLLYLLKDADRLEAQRSRADTDNLDSHEAVPLKDTVAFDTLPRALSTDVELVASSADGSVVVAVGVENEVVVWIKERQAYATVETVDVLLKHASSSNMASAITALAVNDAGTFFAVGTGTGACAVWSIGNGITKAPSYIAAPAASSAVSALYFVESNPPSAMPPNSRPPSPQRSATIVASFENGTVVKWDINSHNPVPITPSRSGQTIWTSLIRLADPHRLIAAFSMDDGTMELLDIVPTGDALLIPDYRITAGSPADGPARAHAAYVDGGGSKHLVIAVATQAGVVSLWDGATGECIALLNDAFGKITHLRICPIRCKPCAQCRDVPVDSFAVSFSVGNAMLVYVAYLPTDGRRCRCSHNRVHTPGDGSAPWGSAGGRRLRSTSQVSSNGSIAPRSRHASISDGEPAFRVSGHGRLSRRSSEKDLRRGPESLPVMFDNDEDDGPSLLDGLPPTSRSRWKDIQVVRTVDASFERGSWDVVDAKLVGVRRRARSTGKAALAMKDAVGAAGLSAASLERWEAWTFDPALALFQSASLAVLAGRPLPCGRLYGTSMTTGLSEETPRLPFTRVAPFVGGGGHGFAGFGNTVGVVVVSAAVAKSR
ncbi:sterol-sensing domain of SREBP cleavage-activation-domain-containing protein [Amylostereum chailletii]|nr:sterol-sensing domain of SREBP cleavage-activation-domain-containing protein [Amylostereum chailletii]